MSDNLTAIILAFCVVVAPVWIVLHYVSKSRGNRQVNVQDAEAFERLSQTAARMEQRMVTLERILDVEVLNWRQSAELGVHNHEGI